MKSTYISFAFVVVFVAFIAYNCGRKDYTNELAVARSVVKYHKDEAEFFYKKWREEESAHYKTRHAATINREPVENIK